MREERLDMPLTVTKNKTDINSEAFGMFFEVPEEYNYENLFLLSDANLEDKILFNALKEHIYNKEKFVLIASSPDNYKTTDMYFKEFKKYFKKFKIKEIELIDKRINKFAAMQKIKSADIVLLTGGNPINQLAFIKEYEIAELIKGFNGTIIGISAGAINLAKIAYCSTDDDFPKSLSYEGLGLTDLTIDPHFDINNKKQVKDFLAQDFEVIGLAENSFIKIDRYGIKTFFGEYYIKENNKIVKVK